MKKAKFLLCKELFQTQTHTSKLKHIGRVILTHTMKEKLNKQSEKHKCIIRDTSVHPNICRTASSLWRPTILASSSVIFELACANFSSAFQQQSHLVEAFSSSNLTSSVRLSWWSLYHSTFLLDSEDVSSSIWQTMFGHAVQKAFLTSLDGISTLSTLPASTTCKVYALHVSQL